MTFIFEAQFYHTVSVTILENCIAIKITTAGFFILLNYDAMCANNVFFSLNYIMVKSAQWSRYSKKPFLRHRDAGWDVTHLR